MSGLYTFLGICTFSVIVVTTVICLFYFLKEAWVTFWDKEKVIHCVNCRHSNYNFYYEEATECNLYNIPVTNKDFCSKGKI